MAGQFGPFSSDEWIAVSAIVTALATVTLVWVTYTYAKAARDLVQVTSDAFVAERAPIISVHSGGSQEEKNGGYSFYVSYRNDGRSIAYNVQGYVTVHSQYVPSSDAFDLVPGEDKALKFVLSEEHVAANGHDISDATKHAEWRDTLGHEYRTERQGRGSALLFRVINGRSVPLNLG